MDITKEIIKAVSQVTGKAGGDKRASVLTSKRKSEIASIAANKRWDEYRKRKAVNGT